MRKIGHFSEFSRCQYFMNLLLDVLYSVNFVYLGTALYNSDC